MTSPEDRCLNDNHGRPNALVRFCSMCGELLNEKILQRCATVVPAHRGKHAKKRLERNKYCVDCGDLLTQ